MFPVDARRLFKSSRPMSRLFEARLSAGLAGVFFLLSQVSMLLLLLPAVLALDLSAPACCS